MAAAAARSRSAGQPARGADTAGSRPERARRPNCRSSPRQSRRPVVRPQRPDRSSRDGIAGEGVERPAPPGAGAAGIRHAVGAEHLTERRRLGRRRPGCGVAGIGADLQRPLLAGLQAGQGVGREAAGRSVGFNEFDHLGFGFGVGLHQAADLARGCLALDRGLDRTTALFALLMQRHDLLALGRRPARGGATGARKAARTGLEAAGLLLGRRRKGLSRSREIALRLLLLLLGLRGRRRRDGLAGGREILPLGSR